MNTTTGVIDSTRSHTKNMTWLVLAIVAPATILPAAFLWAPALTVAIGHSSLGLSPSQIGGMFSIALFCSSGATLPAFLWLRSKHWAKFGFLFMAVFIVSNVLSAWAIFYSFTLYLVIQGFGAISAGSLLIMCTRNVARLPDHKRGRIFGMLIFTQLVLGTIGIAVLPALFKHFGLGAFFYLQAALMCLCLPLCRHYINDLKTTKKDRKADEPAKKHTIYSYTAVGSVFFLYLCLGGIWPFVGSLTESTGMSQSLMTQLLTVSSAIGIVGAGSAVLMGKGRFRAMALMLGFAALVICQLVMAAVPTVGAGYVSVLVFKYTWTLLVPFMLTVTSLLDDRHGNLINSANLLVGFGMGLGPIVCGYLLQTVNYQTMFVFGAAAALIAGICINLSNFNTPARRAGHAD